MPPTESCVWSESVAADAQKLHRPHSFKSFGASKLQSQIALFQKKKILDGEMTRDDMFLAGKFRDHWFIDAQLQGMPV